MALNWQLEKGHEDMGVQKHIKRMVPDQAKLDDGHFLLGYYKRNTAGGGDVVASRQTWLQSFGVPALTTVECRLHGISELKPLAEIGRAHV